jgi:hypothetical protein
MKMRKSILNFTCFNFSSVAIIRYLLICILGNIALQLIICYSLDFYFEYSLLSIIPVVIYSNPDSQKKSILIENKGKSGIYR